MNKKIFITGIGTDVGKTVVSAIVCEALKADYWKPIQAGDADNGDRKTIQNLISNDKTIIHSNTWTLTSAMSPHAAADIDGVKILSENIHAPQINNNLVIEGAGGLLVPINEKETIMDLIKKDHHVIVVAQHYLGSINHTLLSVKLLQQQGYKVSVIFNGNKNTATEDIIQSMTKVHVIGRINQENRVNTKMICKYARLFEPQLRHL